MEKYTTVSVQELSLFIKNECIEGSTTEEKANIEIFVITEVKNAEATLLTLYENVQFECRLSIPPTSPPLLYIYLDWPQLKILSVMYWEAHFVQYTKESKLNTSYSITLLH